MLDPRYITITVQYDRDPTYGRSLGAIAPELKNSTLTMTDDHIAGPRPSRTWAGMVDGPTFERFARAWRLPGRSPARHHRSPTIRIAWLVPTRSTV